MTDPHNERGGRVLSAALTAVLLILAGLGLMALDTYWGDGLVQTPVSFLHNS
jgi:hypothetical protein